MFSFLVALSSSKVCDPSYTNTSNLLSVSAEVTLQLVKRAGSKYVTKVIYPLISEANGRKYSEKSLSSHGCFPKQIPQNCYQVLVKRLPVLNQLQ